MKTMSIEMKAHLAQETTTLVTCWHASLNSGANYYFTDHTRDLSFQDNVYLASTGFTPSAIESTSALNVDNLELEAILDSDLITEKDLLSGKWDHASITVFLVNYEDLSMGRIIEKMGRIGNVSLKQNTYTAEVRSLSQAYTTQLGELYAPVCRARLGDARCKVDLGPRTRTGAIATFTADNRSFTDPARTEAGPENGYPITGISRDKEAVITAPGHIFSDGSEIVISGVLGMIQSGRPDLLGQPIPSGSGLPSLTTYSDTAVLGTGGTLNGQSYIISHVVSGTSFTINVDTRLSSTDSNLGPPFYLQYSDYLGGGLAALLNNTGFFDYGLVTFSSGANATYSMEVKRYVPGVVELQLPMPYPMAVADTYTIVPGCVGRFIEDCKTKFANVLNFRGEPHLPGQDRVVRVGGGVSDTSTVSGTSTGGTATAPAAGSIGVVAPPNASGAIYISLPASSLYNATVTGRYDNIFLTGTITSGGITATVIGRANIRDATTSTYTGRTSVPMAAVNSGVTSSLKLATVAQVAAFLSYTAVEDVSIGNPTAAVPANTDFIGTIGPEYATGGFSYIIEDKRTYAARQIIAPSITWVATTAPGGPGTWKDFAYSPTSGRYVAISEQGGGVYGDFLYSTDGFNWTALFNVNNEYHTDVIWSPQANLFVSYTDALVPGGAIIGGSVAAWNTLTSTDGTSWQQLVNAPDVRWAGHVYAPSLNKWLGLQFLSSSPILHAGVSPDGLTWTLSPLPFSGDFAGRAIGWSPALGLAVAICSSGGDRVSSPVAVSADGINWTMALAPPGEWSSVAWSPALGMFAACGFAFGHEQELYVSIMTSTNGTSWAAIPMTPVQARLTHITWLAERGYFLASGTGTTYGTAAMYLISTDGVNWTPHTGIAGRKLLWDGSRYITVGGHTSGILNAPDTSYWVAETKTLTYSAP